VYIVSWLEVDASRDIQHQTLTMHSVTRLDDVTQHKLEVNASRDIIESANSKSGGQSRGMLLVIRLLAPVGTNGILE
jgi:hypothetical protein